MEEFYLHGKCEDHGEEVLTVAHTLSCFVYEMGDLVTTFMAFELWENRNPFYISLSL